MPTADPVLVVLLLAAGVGITMLGLWLLLGGWLRGPGEQAGPSTDRADEPLADPEPAPAPAAAEPSAAPSPCDWALMVVADGADPMEVRPASGRRCCVHTIHLESLEPVDSGRDVVEGLTWSGEQTRVSGMVVSSDTQQHVTSTERTLDGAGVRVATALGRGPGPTVMTPWSVVPGPGGEGQSRTEQLWATHLETLRERDVRTRAPDMAVTHRAATRDRTRLRIDATRACDAEEHEIHVRARVAVDLVATGSGSAPARATAPVVGAWIEGDLDVAATTVVSASSDTIVSRAEPSPEHPAVSFAADVVSQDARRALVVGDGSMVRTATGLELVVGSDVRQDVMLGDPGADEADVRLEVRVDHDLQVAVMSRLLADEGTGRLQCTCAPAYELRLGELPHDDQASAPDAPATSSPRHVLVVEGTTFELAREPGIAPDDRPRWRVVAADGRAVRPDQGQTDDRDGQADARPAADGGRAGGGQRVDGDVGPADPDAGHAAAG